MKMQIVSRDTLVRPDLMPAMCLLTLTENYLIVRPMYCFLHGHVIRYTINRVVHVVKCFM